jgi:glycosyltransferase involved in cell wall biosynthesis
MTELHPGECRLLETNGSGILLVRSAMSTPTLELSIVMPCLNEAETVGRCVAKARDFLQRQGVSGEVIVADNGSADGSPALAKAAGARVVNATPRGYGAALRAGIAVSCGRYVVMGDSDDSYDFTALAPFLERLRTGDDLVVGNRFRGGIEPGAMPALHRFLGNPTLSLVARLLFRSPFGDIYCGLRGFTRETYDNLDLQSMGMEFALEMIIKATLLRLRISEVPTVLQRAGRSRPPHVRAWRDGRRSLLLYLSCVPGWFFLYPGIAAMAIGLLFGALLLRGPLHIGRLHLDVHTLLYCGTAVLVGFQLVSYSVYLRLLMLTARLLPPDPDFTRRVGTLKLEHGLAAGGALVLAGVLLTVRALGIWRAHAFGDLDPFEVMRLAIPAATTITLGLQIGAAALFFSLLKWQIRVRHAG